MKNGLIILFISLILFACGGVENTEQQNTSTRFDSTEVIDLMHTTEELRNATIQLDSTVHDINNEIDSLLNGI